MRGCSCCFRNPAMIFPLPFLHDAQFLSAMISLLSLSSCSRARDMIYVDPRLHLWSHLSYKHFHFFVQSENMFPGLGLQCAGTTDLRRAISTSLRRYPGARIKHVPAKLISVFLVSICRLTKVDGDHSYPQQIFQHR
jgi:hypothetical protein